MDLAHLTLGDGARLAYCVVGPPPGRAHSCTLLCFNPGGCTLLSWERTARHLAAVGVRCILHDCRGVGASAPATADGKAHDAQYTFDTYAGDARALLEHLAVEDAVICGSSWGARPAAVTAALLGGRAAGVCLFDISFGKAEPPLQKSGERLARDKLRRLGLGAVEPGPEWKRFLAGKSADRAMNATNKPPYDAAATFAAAVLPSDERAASGILCPALIALGEFDPNLVAKPGGANDVFNWLQARPHAITEMRVMEAVGHASVVYRPMLCAQVLCDFLGRLGMLDGGARAEAARAATADARPRGAKL